MRKIGKVGILILTLVFCFSYASAQQPTSRESLAQYLLWVAQNELGVATFSIGTMLYVIENGYYPELTPGQKGALKKVLEETKASLASELDKHSTYHSAEQIEATIEEETKQFEGIGVVVGIPDAQKTQEKFERLIRQEILKFKFDDPDKKFVKAAIEWITKTNTEAAELYKKITKGIIPPEGLLINEIIPGGAAVEYGIKKGWLIKTVDGKTLQGMELKKAIELIKGPAGTKVELSLFPPVGDNTAHPYVIKVIRKNVKRHYISYNMAAPKTGYLKIPDFYESVSQDFKTAITDLKSRGAEKLIIDLRNNPGGLLDMAGKILDILSPAGRIEIYAKYRGGKINLYLSPPKTESQPKEKIVILINKNSASASELMAISLQEQKVATIIGEQSFGKGSIQTIIPLPDGSVFRLTIGRYYSPVNDICVDEKGVTPDIQITDDPTTPQDEVLKRAIQELSK